MSGSAEHHEIALVTGANKGIGFQVASELGKAGMTVYVGARDISRGEEAAKALHAKGCDARFVQLDLADSASVERAAAVIRAEQGRLDVLVNNAGITTPGDGTPGEADLAAVRRTFDTNFFDTVMVTQKMLPLLRQSKAGRVVNVSSGLGSLTLNSDPDFPYSGLRILGYQASKAALNMFTVLLAKELRDAGILVNSVDPGYTATDLNDNRGHQTVEEGSRETVRLALAPEGVTGRFFDKDGSRPW
jgi:NAD(P)-dependent dehydrogenase (short-subunit alcohol dehydrogenase family)